MQKAENAITKLGGFDLLLMAGLCSWGQHSRMDGCDFED